MLSNVLNQNPDVKSILNESGGDYKKAFYAYAEKVGIDPEQIISAIK